MGAVFLAQNFNCLGEAVLRQGDRGEAVVAALERRQTFVQVERLEGIDLTGPGIDPAGIALRPQPASTGVKRGGRRLKADAKTADDREMTKK